MAKGPARIIVNQVTGSSATAMNGFLEVAGNKADVVIANPNGITVNGGGFINTGRAILTTGKPEFDAGENLEDLRVNGNGTILIDGKGLDGRKADSLAIYTRAARVNAAIWANTLQVTTGANAIEAETGKAVPITPEGKQPEVALDVSAVGGMYAGRIFLVGTEKGLGFYMDGNVNTDDLILDADGHLYHSGTIHAAKEADLKVSSIENHGNLVSEGKLKIQSDGNLVNTGTLGAERKLAVHADAITNDQAVIASEGSLSMETTGNGTTSLSNREGKILSNGTTQVRTNSLDNTKGALSSGADLVLKGNTLTNEEGKITAFGNSQITEKEKLNNRSGSLESHGDTVIAGNVVDNHNGTMDAGGSLTVTAAALQLDGTLAAGKDMTLHTGDSVTNDNAESSYGITRAGGNLFLVTTGTLTNSRKIEAGKTLSIEAGQIENRAEGELNGKSLTLKTQTVTNRGLVNGDRDLSIETGTLLNLETGRIYGEDISIIAGRLENRKDKALEESLAAAMKTLHDKEKALDEAYGVDVTAFHSDGEKEAFFKTIEEMTGDYEKAKAEVDGIRKEMEGHPSAALAARGSMAIAGNTLLNSSGALLYSGGDMTLAEKESVINRGGTINAQGNLSITAPVISNENESFSSERVWTSHVTNPRLIRIDQDGHPERGQAFPESEFSRLSSGYGAYHNKGITPKEPLEEAAYGIITAPTEEELAEGEDPVDPSLVGTLAPNYAYDDPIFQQFGITSMTTARPKNGDPAQKAWDESYQKILDALNVKIREYNREVEAYNNSIGAIEGAKIKNYTIIRTNTHTSEKKVTETKAGILSGGKNMTLVGNVTNENSRITAGKILAVQGNLTNEEAKNRVEKVTFGTTQESYTKKKHWPHKAHRRHYRSEIFMTPQKDLENPTSFGVAETKENSSDTSDSMDITKAGRENVQSYLNPFQSSKETHPGTAEGDKGTSIPFLSESALYRLHPEETATYLVETDPAFTNKHRFLSSDYMYRQMTWDPDRVTKRLGDGFYEQELVRQQIAGLTGMRYLNGYTDDEEEYKALMDAGIAYAKEYNLKPGISLTKEQMASLTSDMVWLETTTVTVNEKTYEVLYPKVYLKPGTMTLTSDGSLISADTLVAETKETLENNASILGNTVALKGNGVINLGSILGKDITLKAERDVIQNGLITGEDSVALTAGRDISMGNTILHGKNQDILDTTAGIAVKGKEGVLLMQAGRDMTLNGATLAALGEKGSMILSAGHNLTMDTDTLEARKDMTEDVDNYIRTYRKTETANTLTAGKDITMTAGNNIKARNTSVSSESGAIAVKAGNDVTVENGYHEAIDDYGLKYKESGFLSHKTTGIKSHDESKTAMGSLLSGDTVAIVSSGNTEVTASNVVGTNGVSIASGKDTTITSAAEAGQHNYEKRTRKSGLLGGGLGFTIGSEKQKDQYADADVTQKGSSIGSMAGNVTIQADKNVHVDASDIIAGKDIAMTGENVTISSKGNVYHNDEKHEYKKSGLTISIGGATIDAMDSVVQPINRAGEVKDKRLAGLYAVKAGQEASQIAKTYKNQQDVIDDLYAKASKEMDFFAKGRDWEEADKIKDNQWGGKNTFTLHADIGSSHSRAESHSETKEAAGSHVSAAGDVTIKATKEDIRIKGSQMTGENVTLDAKEDIAVSAAENSHSTRENIKSSGASLGASIGAGGLQGISASYSKAKGNIKESETTYEKSQVAADENLTFTSGKDTTIAGSEMKGNRVIGNAGGNLSIETKQDKKSYEEKNTRAGLTINYGVKNGKTGAVGGASKDTIQSSYESAASQAGIHAGEGGFHITVKNNTGLKGGVIGSDASKDKNNLTTGTLTWENTQNRSDYKVGGMGLSYFPNDKSNALNRRGLRPDLSPAVQDKVGSTTKSAIVEGTIHITNKEQQKQTVSGLNRDTGNSLNQLQEIFDKAKVQEKQELVGMLERYGNQAIHKYAENKGWKDGSTEKMLLHGVFGALMDNMAGGNVTAGALAGSVNEYVMGYLARTKGEEWVQKHPDTVQWISAGVGAVIGNVIIENGINGADITINGTKWNFELSESIHEASDIIWNFIGEEDKEKLQQAIESNSVTYGISILAKYTIKYYPQMVKEYPEVFEGVRDLGNLKSAYSIAGYIWLYYETRYKNRPDSVGYNTWLNHEIDGGQRD